jgi:hypothetical protein
MKQLTQKVWQTGNSWRYEALYAAGVGAAERLRVRIERDAYDNQNTCDVEIFDHAGNRWNVLASVPKQQMKCNAISYVKKGVTAADFAADERTLLDEAALIIN